MGNSRLDSEPPKTLSVCLSVCLSISRSLSLSLSQVSMVVDALLHAVSSPRPQYRYLLASRLDSLFFSWYPLLPTAVSDGIFALSPMYARRRKMLYSKQ